MYPRCDLETQPETPRSSQKAVSRGVSGLLKVNDIDGELIHTERARGIAGSKLSDESE